MGRYKGGGESHIGKKADITIAKRSGAIESGFWVSSDHD
jgi:hypothetical protein